MFIKQIISMIITIIFIFERFGQHIAFIFNPLHLIVECKAHGLLQIDQH